MKYQKKKLLKIVKKVLDNSPLSPEDVDLIINFEKNEKENPTLLFIKKIAFPVAVILGFAFAAFSLEFEKIEKNLPSWTNMPTPMLLGADYIWGFIGEPVGKANILYHLPNIILYSFGIIGLKKLFDAIDRRTWLDNVLRTRDVVKTKIEKGDLNYSLKKGHSILFVGRGDFIGMQFALNGINGKSILVSEVKPEFTNIWNYFNVDSDFENLEIMLSRTDLKSAGEYVFFPVKDDQVFLPGPTAYDLSPHKLDILCQDIRSIERKNKLKSKRIIVVGDKYHQSIVYSEDKNKRIKNSRDLISINSISKKYENITIIDPTDIVLREIIKIAKGRKIIFRATEAGIKEYKNRFYERLFENGYKYKNTKKGNLIIGYDIFEDQTEQQTLKKIDGYYPVVLSKIVRDALLRNGYKNEEFLYVPDLVLSVLSEKTEEQ